MKEKKPRIPRKATTPFLFQAWFEVETVHGAGLERVLEEADIRQGELSRIQVHPQGRVTATYTDKLFDMFKKEFKNAKAGTRVVESQEYGTLSFRVEANAPAALQSALVRCEKVTARWLNKYRINSMKGV